MGKYIHSDNCESNRMRPCTCDYEGPERIKKLVIKPKAKEMITLLLVNSGAFTAEISMQNGQLMVRSGGMLGYSFAVDPDSARQAAQKVLEVLNAV